MDRKEAKSLHTIRKQDVRLAKLCRLCFHDPKQIPVMLTWMIYAPVSFNRRISQPISSAAPSSSSASEYRFVCFDSSKDARVILVRKHKNLYLVFRPTRSLSNWWHNLQIDLVPWMNESCRVHRGFKSLYSGLQSFVLSTVNTWHKRYKFKRIICTGMSLGGALAELCAVDLAGHGPTTGIECRRLVTFGAPRVGNEAWSQLVSSLLTTRVHYSNKDDPVPRLPLTTLTHAYCTPHNQIDPSQCTPLPCSGHVYYLGVEFASDSLLSGVQSLFQLASPPKPLITKV